MKKESKVLIIGGGLAGLTSAIHLSLHQIPVILIEKQSYPKHKVCGEYVSNEVLSYCKDLGIDPLAFGAKDINQFQFSGLSGKTIDVSLPLGGLGISRYTFDKVLYDRAISLGVVFIQDVVTKVDYVDDFFNVATQSGNEFLTKYVLGAYGKRSGLDISLSRKFIQERSPWLGVKAHYKADFPDNLVALHNFEGGYCGLSKVETNHVNACYLTHFDVFKECKDLKSFQKLILERNEALRNFFENAEMVFDKPLTISQISFKKKQPVENHILMIGDSAGLIHPLCGNGMAMAIHSAKIVSTALIQCIAHNLSRIELEKQYRLKWNRTFSRRLQVGKFIQKALLDKRVTKTGVSLVRKSPFLLKKIIQSTHGNPI